MAKNLKMFFDTDGSPRARGPSSEKLLMAFLEADVQGSDHICHDLMDDITAIEDESAETREFVGNAHSVVMSADGVTIECTIDDVADDDESDPELPAQTSDEQTTAAADQPTDSAKNNSVAIQTTESPKIYQTGLKHFREVLEDWEAFILDDNTPT